MAVLSEQADALRSDGHLSPFPKGECHGTFGELMQGVLPDDRHFLVTLPVNLKSIVEFEITHSDHVAVDVGFKTKACRAVQDYLRLHDLPPGGMLHFKSMFAVGKGLAVVGGYGRVDPCRRVGIRPDADARDDRIDPPFHRTDGRRDV